VQLIFVVQCETEIGQNLRDLLAQAKYSVHLFTRPIDLVAEAERHSPSLIFIEVGSPPSRGLAICRAIRVTPGLTDTPLILFSSGSGHEDRILALESGADDYLTQPFTQRELIARVQAVLRRCTGRSCSTGGFSSQSDGFTPHQESVPGPVITLGDIQIDMSAMKISIRGSEVSTTALEFRLLSYLSQHRSRVFTRDQLLDAVWGDKQFVTPRSVDACIRRVRSKIEPNRMKPTYLKTVRGAGYLLEATARGKGAPSMAAAGVRNTSAMLSSTSALLADPMLGTPLKEA